MTHIAVISSAAALTAEATEGVNPIVMNTRATVLAGLWQTYVTDEALHEQDIKIDKVTLLLSHRCVV